MPAGTRWSLLKDCAGGVVFIVLGGVFLRETGELPPAAAKYPAIIIYLIFGLSLLLLARAAVLLVTGKYAPARAGATDDGEAEEKFGFPTVFVLALSLAYILAMPYVGFAVASAAMMILFMLAMGIRSLPALILIPLAEIAFLLYVFETLLAVFLPDAEWLKTALGFV